MLGAILVFSAAYLVAAPGDGEPSNQWLPGHWYAIYWLGIFALCTASLIVSKIKEDS
jgi:hypothetical protein